MVLEHIRLPKGCGMLREVAASYGCHGRVQMWLREISGGRDLRFSAAFLLSLLHRNCDSEETRAKCRTNLSIQNAVEIQV